MPVTKSIPKELLPLAGKPLIQFALEEAAASGIETVVLVNSPRKAALEHYFLHDSTLEKELEHAADLTAAETLRRLTDMLEVRVVLQEQPRGLGAAIACAQKIVGDEPFAVMLPDNIIIVAGKPCTRQLMDAYAEVQGCVIAIHDVARDAASRSGIVAGEPVQNERWGTKLLAVNSLIEKPTACGAPSQHAIFGRYLLMPGIFEAIARTPPDPAGEIQITDSLAIYAQSDRLFGFRFEGDAYDAGNKLEFMKAGVELTLRDAEFAPHFRTYLSSLKLSA